ncbi:MAG: M10 family metallopeptidase C-terminal domain-containing protein [Inquilinus sp.]|uniref:M10 family metallopeptidase C-terminal domain-containing protein n=1 Tax=Inquilinus sp. TaxID=1932117 RepID=UPI003F311CD2
MALSLELLGLLGVNLEDTNDDVLVGGNIIDVLSGGDGDDVIEGKGGADVISGGDGIDTLSYETSPAAVNVSLVPGLLGLISLNSGGDATGDLVSNGFENVVGSAFADTLTGDNTANTLVGLAGDDTLNGGGGNDVLVGGSGNDRMDGGAGVDTANYVDSSTAIIADLTAGTGTNPAGTEHDTLIGIEDLTGSRFADTLTGDAGDNALVGGAGDDTITGGAGKDAIDGGTGSDRASYAASNAAVIISLAAGTASGGHAQGDVLTHIESLTGSAFNDKLSGDDGTNVLSGGAGNDIIFAAGGDDFLYGGAGADQIDGGSGADTVHYVGSSAAVTVNLGTNINTGGEADGDTLFNVNNVVGSSFADHLTGDAFDNTLSGVAGNDVLNGGGGDDILFGGTGADQLNGSTGLDAASYEFSAAAVTVSLTTGTGTGGDAAGDTLTNVEKLIGSNFADTLTGDANANDLRGGNGNDVLSGLDGDDTLIGGAGADTLNGGAGVDGVFYTKSNVAVTVNLSTGFASGGHAQGDLLIDVENAGGSEFNDTLTGTSGKNVLSGDLGNDTIRGGGGADELVGGAGADTFVYTATSDSPFGAGDLIRDFSHAQGDHIDLSGIDANTGAAGDQAFNFIGNSLYSGTAGELRFANTAPGVITIAGDVNGDGVSDFHINVYGTSITASDFVL